MKEKITGKTIVVKERDASLYNRLCFLILFCTLVLPSKLYAQANPFRIKVMSFNVCRSGELTKHSVAPFAALIRQYEPDFIALQEVDSMTTRSDKTDFATDLGAALGMFPAFGKAISYQGGKYGIAILSKFPFQSLKVEALPSPKGTKEQRAVLIAKIVLPSGENIRFTSTHLDHSTETVRTAMINALNAFLPKDNTPTILGGDFNALPSEGSITDGMQQWQQIGNDDPTFPDNPTEKIDYLFGYPKETCKTISYQVIKQTGISDHCAILAELEFQQSGNEKNKQ